MSMDGLVMTHISMCPGICCEELAFVTSDSAVESAVFTLHNIGLVKAGVLECTGVCYCIVYAVKSFKTKIALNFNNLGNYFLLCLELSSLHTMYHGPKVSCTLSF